MTHDEQPPIGDYALIGCTRSAALISRSGSIDWLAWPRFDAPSVFARILDWQRGGVFSFAPAGSVCAARRLLRGTECLQTAVAAPRGGGEVVDPLSVVEQGGERGSRSAIR